MKSSRSWRMKCVHETHERHEREAGASSESTKQPELANEWRELKRMTGRERFVSIRVIRWQNQGSAAFPFRVLPCLPWTKNPVLAAPFFVTFVYFVDQKSPVARDSSSALACRRARMPR